MTSKFLLVAALALGLGACGHRPLKAPCEPGDAQPLSSFFIEHLPEAFRILVSTSSECGPLHRL
jgi:hypothetical protein